MNRRPVRMLRPAGKRWRPEIALLLAAAIVALLAGRHAATAQPAGETDRYRVRFGNSDTVHVEAVLHTATGTLVMWQGMRPDTRASHVSGFEAHNAKGDAIAAIYSPADASWRLAFGADETVEISYDADLGWLRKLPAWARLQYGFFDTERGYIAMKDLVIVADDLRSVRPAEIAFESPRPVLSPWEAARTSNTYRATVADVADNSIVVGDGPKIGFERGGLDVSVALFGAAAQAQGHIRRAVIASLDQDLKLFGMPRARRFLMIVASGDEDGQAFAQSTAISTRVPFLPAAAPVWANTIAHELFHIWNAHGIRTIDPKLAFFTEGFTEYYANKELLHAGLIDEAQYWSMAAQHLGAYSYFNAHSDLSIAAAGTDNGRNRFGVYDGGWTAALCLDLELRTQSGGGKSLDDAMRLLWSRFGTADIAMTYGDLQTAAGEAAGRSFEAFFTKYVAGEDELPFRKDMREIGVDVFVQPFSAEGYIAVHPGAAHVRFP